MKILSIAVNILATCSFSSAAVVSYSFTGVVGTVNMNDNAILGVLNSGDTVSGSFSYDLLLPSGGTAADRMIAISIGSRDISISSTLNFVRTQNNVSVSGLGIVDRFRFAFDSSGPTTFLDPLYLYQLDIEFIDTSALIYDGTQTLDVDLILEDYDVVRFFIRGADLATRTDDFSVNGTLTSVAVPEPSSAAFLLGASLIILRRKRKSEQGGDGDAEEAL